MSLSSLKNNFAGKAAAAGIAALVAITPLTGATAQNQQSQHAEFTQASVANIAFSRDATRDAGEWSQRNSGISVAVYLGTRSGVTPEQIEQILTREIQNAGVRNVSFFYEQNDVANTGVAYAYGGDLDGPFNLAEARPAATKAARQYLYQRQLSYNMER